MQQSNTQQQLIPKRATVGFALSLAGMETAGGIIVLIFSVLSILVSSGWLAGLILGVIGGILCLLKK